MLKKHTLFFAIASISLILLQQSTTHAAATQPRQTQQVSLKKSLSSILVTQDVLLELAEGNDDKSTIANLILTHAYPYYWDENGQTTPLHLALATHDNIAYESAFYTLRTIKNFLLGTLSKEHGLSESAQRLQTMVLKLETNERKEVRELIENICLFCQLAEDELASRYGPVQHAPDGSLETDIEIKKAQFALEQARKRGQKYTQEKATLAAKTKGLEQELQEAQRRQAKLSRRERTYTVDNINLLKDKLAKYKAIEKALSVQAKEISRQHFCP